MGRKNLQTINKYTFKAEDDWGCYNEKGEYLKGSFDKDGYSKHNFRCTDGKKHIIREHNMKWEYFYGRLPEDKVIDHIIPISSGGTNKLSNLRLVTPKENSNNPLTRKNLSKALKGKYKGEKHWMTGKHHSEETKAKMSKSASERQFGEKNPFYGKHWNENQREAHKKCWKKVKLVKPNGEEIIYDSATIAAKENDLSNSSISMACKNKFGKLGNVYNSCKWYYIW